MVLLMGDKYSDYKSHEMCGGPQKADNRLFRMSILKTIFKSKK